jgi:Josephin
MVPAKIWILILIIILIIIIALSSNHVHGGDANTDLFSATRKLDPRAFYEALKSGANVRNDDILTILTSRMHQENSTDANIRGKLIMSIIRNHAHATLARSIPVHSIPVHSVLARPDYAERQTEGESCGRHALNNLFGGAFFQKDNGLNVSVPPNALTKLSFGNPISLQSLCIYINRHALQPVTAREACPPSENYDINVLRAGINMLGFESEQCRHQTLDTCLRKPNVVGFIVNYGAGHWVAVKKIPDERWRYINSIPESTRTPSATVITYNTFQDYLTSYGGRIEAFLVVYSTDRDFINPMTAIMRSAQQTQAQTQRSPVKGQVADELRPILEPFNDERRPEDYDYRGSLMSIVHAGDTTERDLQRIRSLKQRVGIPRLTQIFRDNKDGLENPVSVEYVLDFIETIAPRR